MIRLKKQRFGRWLRRHRIALLLITGISAVTAGLLIWYAASTGEYVTATSVQIAKSNEESAEIAKRAAEQRALREAEEKVAQEKAAKEAAEQARTSDGDAAAIDSKTCNASKTHANPASIDVVVNKKHCIQPLGYAPSDLVTSHDATLSARAIDAFNQLFAAAAAAGQPFYVTSSYRSYATQVSTYNYWVSVSGRDGADTYSARPGYSEHQTGLAFDVAANGCVLDCFGTTSQYQWLQANAANYGFIQRYYAGYEAVTGYKAEEWHYRYVGATTAKDMQFKGIKTLEQYWNIPGGDY